MACRYECTLDHDMSGGESGEATAPVAGSF
jgi:hypothetical protein